MEYRVDLEGQTRHGRSSSGGGSHDVGPADGGLMGRTQSCPGMSFNFLGPRSELAAFPCLLRATDTDLNVKN